MLVLLGAVLVAIAATALTITGKTETTALPEAAVKQEKVNMVTAYVAGAVQRPGVVTLPAGERIITAVERCGGVLPNADIKAVNMAEPVQDGMKIIIPELVGESTATATAKGFPADKISINRAGERELDTLPGIGPAMAKRIIDYRNEKGAFQRLEDLKKVRGIGEAKYERLKDKICL